jgi:hypothetical protein
MFTTHLITARADLAALEMPWNILAAGEPMRSWNWLATWWKYYGSADNRELHVLAVYDEDENGKGPLVGIAPWYVEHTPLHGNVLRQLGDGKVCTDHLSILCHPKCIASVVTTIADYLIANDDNWDRMEFEAIDEGDDAMTLLVSELEARNALVSCQQSCNCWVIDLPETWGDYLEMVSHSHRRQLIKWQKDYVESGRSRLHLVTSPAELEEAWGVFVDLHTSRRQSLGDEGCFASEAFNEFHRDVAGQLLDHGQLRMSWIELDGKPFTAEYHFFSPETVYTYQSGADATRLKDAPGRLAWLTTIQRAIADGFPHLDFLRGDEPYKAHFRAQARPAFDYHVFPNRGLARLRGHMLLAAGAVKHWVKQNVGTGKS